MIKNLIKEVEKRYGGKIATSNDCKYLSQDISDAINELISESTLRRFFGFLKTTSKPSVVTLNILSKFVGFEDWKDFQLNRDIENIANNDDKTWLRSFDISKKISLENINATKAKTGVNFDKITQRQFASERISAFIKNNFTATAFIAPGGSGKSMILSKWTSDELAKEKHDNIILYLKAQSITSKLSKETEFENYISSLLGINKLSDLKECLPQKNTKNKLVIVIDAIDELSHLKQKLEFFFFEIIKLIIKYKDQKFLKIMVSTRNTTWENCVSIITNSGKSISDAWYDVELRYNIHNKTNIPPLSRKEIQTIFDLTINTKSNKKIVVDELNHDLRYTISHPYFLQLFIKIFNPDIVESINSSADLLDEFLKTQIYYSNNSDEKIDILYTIINKSNAGIDGQRIKKKFIKEDYPIHLKHAGNYFEAYQEMLSFGIISEEIVENIYGLYTKYVFITHQNVFETLVINQLIDYYEGINFELFINLETYYYNKDILPVLISLAYQKAYKNRNHEVLSDFFSLNDKTLDNIQVAETIGNCLRGDKFMRETLVPIYAKNIKARKYYFEKYIDTNYLIHSYKYQMQHYYNNSTTKEEKIFSISFLLQAEIVSLEFDKYNEYYTILRELKPEKGMSPLIISRWLACMLTMSFVDNDSELLTYEDVRYYKELSKQHLTDNRSKNEPEFEFYVLPVLLLSGRIDIFTKFLEAYHPEATEGFLKESISEKNSHSALFSVYLKSLISNKIEELNIKQVEKALDTISLREGYIGIMTSESLLCKYYFSIDDIVNALKYFSEGIKIATSSGYKLYELLLLDVFLKEIKKTKSKINISNYEKRHQILHSKLNFLPLHY